MTAETPAPKTNFNTWLSVAGFALVILGMAVTLGNFQASTEATQLEMSRNIEELKAQQARDAARSDDRIRALEEAVNALNIRDARNDERMNSILETLRRIDAKLTAQELRDKGEKP